VKKSTKYLVLVCALLLVLGAVFGTVKLGTAHAADAKSADNIHEVSCDTQTAFLRIFTSSGGVRCFTDSGTMSSDIDGVYRVCAGNNRVTFDIDTTDPGFGDGSVDESHGYGIVQLDQYECRIFTVSGKVTLLGII
jgi:hypothetical protein